LQLAVGELRGLAGDEALGLDDAPVAEAGEGAEILDLLDVGGRIDRREQA